MKNKIAAVLSAVMVGLSSVNTLAATGIIGNNKTLVQLRGVFDELGFTVEWETNTSTAHIYDSNHSIFVSKGKKYFTVDGIGYSSDVIPQVINGNMYLPLKAIGDSIGASTSWDAENKTAHISYNGKDSYVHCAGNNYNGIQTLMLADTYKDYPKIPDFADFTGYKLVKDDTQGNTRTYTYILPEKSDTVTKNYIELVTQYGGIPYSISKHDNEYMHYGFLLGDNIVRYMEVHDNSGDYAKIFINSKYSSSSLYDEYLFSTDKKKKYQFNGNRGYVGEVNLNGDPNGYGIKFVTNDHISYAGNWVDGVKSGTGEFYWENGNSYIGAVKSNQPDGYGTMIFKGIGTYSGNFSYGKRSGSGTFTWFDGDKYKGNWTKDKMNGEGTYTFADGTVLTGTWKNNEFVE